MPRAGDGTGRARPAARGGAHGGRAPRGGPRGGPAARAGPVPGDTWIAELAVEGGDDTNVVATAGAVRLAGDTVRAQSARSPLAEGELLLAPRRMPTPVDRVLRSRHRGRAAGRPAPRRRAGPAGRPLVEPVGAREPRRPGPAPRGDHVRAGPRDARRRPRRRRPRPAAPLALRGPHPGAGPGRHRHDPDRPARRRGHPPRWPSPRSRAASSPRARGSSAAPPPTVTSSSPGTTSSRCPRAAALSPATPGTTP